MSEPLTPEASIPLVEEHVRVDKRVVETGRVRIRTVVDEKLVRVAEDLERDDVTIERVAVNREVSEPPLPREEDGVLIVPILEEVVVVEKRLFLKEELRIHRKRSREHVEAAVRLRSMRPEVQRVAPVAAGGASANGETAGAGEALKVGEPFSARAAGPNAPSGDLSGGLEGERQLVSRPSRLRRKERLTRERK